MRMLVAEDDAVLADGVTHTLRQSGYAVDWVKNGAEADSALAGADEFSACRSGPAIGCSLEKPL